MTEFEAAYHFVIRYAESVSAAARAGFRLDDRTEFSRYCGAQGIEPTPERLSLARGIRAAAREYAIRERIDRRGPLGEVPVRCLSDGLECYGWRVDFLNQDVTQRSAGTPP